MAKCGKDCPYYWYDSDCEYCSARGDEVIDLENYSYDTCPYFQNYLGKHPIEQKKWEESKKASESGSGGGFVWLLIIGAIIWWLFLR